MRKLFYFGLLFIVVACQPDSTDEPNPLPSSDINFVGTWSRDSVLVNDIAPSGLKVRIETFANLGTYKFNADNLTGTMSHSASDFAITWKYANAANTITISEIDWDNQLYQIKQLNSTKVILTGYLNTGGGNQNERILYLTKK
jgi:hypothetical protein